MLPAAAVVGAFKHEMKGAIMIKPYNRPAGEGKQANRPVGVEMPPSAACGGVSPGGGDLLYAYL